jgi:phosphatidylserine/phosphatidylglycerophosphate/cardiolipin synthase-like enzyme
MKISRTRLMGVFVFALLPIAALAAVPEATPVEIVQSIPEGTALSLPGLRQAKDVWPEMIANAKSQIEIAQMYISGSPGRALEPVVQALEAAGNRGVKIRFLLWIGMKDTDKATVARIQAIPNLTLALYDISKVTGGILHAKYWIIDGKRIFVGSQNFDWLSLEEIHETGVLVESESIAARLETIFEHDWKFATTGNWENDSVPGSSRPPTDVEMVSSPERLNPTGIPVAIAKLISLINGAKQHIQIALLDYTTKAAGKPWLEIDDALRAAAKRGIRVQLLVSHWNTAKAEIASIQSLAKVPGIEVKISFVPDLPSGHIPFSRVIHSKHMIVDGQTYWVGTSNWSRGYFYDTRDIEIVMNRPELAHTGQKIFNLVWTAPYTENLDPTRSYPEPKK